MIFQKVSRKNKNLNMPFIQNFKKAPLLEKLLLISLIIILITVFILGIQVMKSTFANPNIDTTALTNYGFALLAASASICFSWYRTLDEAEFKELKKDVRTCGERGFMSAIFFLLASFFKYCELHQQEFPSKSSFIQSLIVFCQVNYAFMFLCAFAFGVHFLLISFAILLRNFIN